MLISFKRKPNLVKQNYRLSRGDFILNLQQKEFVWYFKDLYIFYFNSKFIEYVYIPLICLDIGCPKWQKLNIIHDN